MGAVLIPASGASAATSPSCKDYYTGITFSAVAGRESQRVNAGYSNCGPGIDHVKVELSNASDGKCTRVASGASVDLSYVPNLWFKKGTAKIVRCNGDTGAIYLDPRYV